MKTRLWFLLAAVVVLGAYYVFNYTEWIDPDPIQIQAQAREMPLREVGRSRVAARGKEAKAAREAAKAEAKAGSFEGMYPVVFALDGEYRITSLRVIEDQASAPGRAPLIVWQLDSASNSVPTKALVYGRTPRGMKLKDERSKPERLKPGVTYRLELKAGRYQGQVLFQAKETPAEQEPAP
jgi:hypothetical protein